MALALNARGLFTWGEWATISATRSARAGGGRSRCRGDLYRHWLAALERMVADKG